MEKKIICFGEIMLRLAAPGYLRFSQANEFVATYCGGEANVAVSLANFGMDAEFVTRLPKNDISDACLRSLHKNGVNTKNVIFGGERLGLYYLETGAVTRPGKVIYDREHSSFSEINPGMIDWKNILRNADWFHWTGITPAISEGAAEACLEAIEVAQKMGLIISTDLNYRKTLWKYGKTAAEVMPKLVEKSDIILGNEEDAETIFGIKPEGFDATKTLGNVNGNEFYSVCEKLMAKFPNAKKIIITLRGSFNANHNTWAGVLFNGKQLLKSPTYDITHIVNRVGGGDSFMGGLIYGLLTYPNEDQKALNFATAASCLKHTIYGDFNLSTVTEVERLMSGDGSGRVNR